MEIIKTTNKLCLCCMEVHDVHLIELNEVITFKGKQVEFVARHEYCDKAEEFLSHEDMISGNDIAMKNAYRRLCDLLTSDEIIAVREKYSISQKDLAALLGWGEKTITRYEGHHVQDMAHDSVLRKIADDPEWFLELLEKGKNRISQEAYEKYKTEISKEYEIKQDTYLRKSIQAQYIKYQNNPLYYGNTKLDFDKVIDVICYYANSNKVNHLYKVKLMKLLWYADCLSYKKYNHSITGLVYKAMPMGALPIAHKSIIDLKGITYEEIEFDNGSGYKFVNSGESNYDSLNKNDISILDSVIEVFGNINKDQIVERMHEEDAYKFTNAGEIISYEYAKDLSIN